MKKLATILALTGILLNLGIATTVFAQESVSGSQSIGCTVGGGVGIDSATSDTVTFEAKDAAWYGGAANANIDPTNTLDVVVTDTRGYDASAANCGLGGDVQIQAGSGLTNTIDTLYLELGGTLAAGDLSCTGTCSPTTLSTVWTVPATSGNITAAALTILDANEAFEGTVTAVMADGDLQVTTPAGSVSTGTYTGTITISWLQDT